MGEIIDQTAFNGLLKTVSDLGMPFLSVNRVFATQEVISDE
jgi:hypothetical protein